MPYIENPKTKGSGIICAIPQSTRCPNNCPDCFFQSGRSYLEPLEDNLPNMPTVEQAEGRVVRVNDGNDSSVDINLVIDSTLKYKDKFYNTSDPRFLHKFPAPVVLTVNPGKMTDEEAYFINPTDNLMFVRVRINTWNIEVVNEVIGHYTAFNSIPVVLTFMAYYDTPIPTPHAPFYVFRRRTLNSYWAIKGNTWRTIMLMYSDNKLVYSCSNEALTTLCKHCGNCLREYYATKERMRK